MLAVRLRQNLVDVVLESAERSLEGRSDIFVCRLLVAAFSTLQAFFGVRLLHRRSRANVGSLAAALPPFRMTGSRETVPFYASLLSAPFPTS